MPLFFESERWFLMLYSSSQSFHTLTHWQSGNGSGGGGGGGDKGKWGGDEDDPYSFNSDNHIASFGYSLNIRGHIYEIWYSLTWRSAPFEDDLYVPYDWYYIKKTDKIRKIKYYKPNWIFNVNGLHDFQGKELYSYNMSKSGDYGYAILAACIAGTPKYLTEKELIANIEKGLDEGKTNIPYTWTFIEGYFKNLAPPSVVDTHIVGTVKVELYLLGVI